MSLWGKTDSTGSRPLWHTQLNQMDTAGRQVIFISTEEAQLPVNKLRGFNSPGWWAYYEYETDQGERKIVAECLVALAVAQATAGDQADDRLAADTTPTPITISAQPTNQTTYTPAGSITAYTVGAGTTLAGEANEVYTLTGLAGSAAGTGAAFTVTRGAGGAIDSVAINAVGTGFVAAETITILGSTIGGVNTTDNLVVTVTGVGTAAATFSVTAAGQATLQYQWQRQTASGTTWSNIAGATSASLALTGLTTAANGNKYRVRISSTGGATTVTSNSATLTVDANIFV